MYNFSAPWKAAFVLFALLASACSGGGEARKDPSKSTVTEEIDAHTFRNDYFGITVTKPDSWHAASLELQQQLMGMGEDIIAHNNDDMKRALEGSTKRSVSLFMFNMYEFGAPEPVNPGVMGVAEYVGFLPGVKNGSDYFFHAKNLMMKSGMQYEFVEGYRQRIIDGVTFDAMDLTMTFNGTRVKQTYYAARHGDHVISLIESYGTDEFKDATSAILDSAKLDW